MSPAGLRYFLYLYSINMSLLTELDVPGISICHSQFEAFPARC